MKYKMSGRIYKIFSLYVVNWKFLWYTFDENKDKAKGEIYEAKENNKNCNDMCSSCVT